MEIPRAMRLNRVAGGPQRRLHAPFKTLEQIEGNLAQDSQILGATGLGCGLLGYIERPMQARFQWLRVAESNVLACPARVM